MGDKTKIAWTNATWNPVAGCTRVSPGCDHCYAFALHDKRYAQNRIASRGAGVSLEQMRRDLQENRGGQRPPWPIQYDTPFSTVQLMPERLDAPLHWRKPRRIFVNSMSDLFHEDVPDELIDRVFAVMMLARQHTFQILTKRPYLMREYVAGLTFERLIAASNKTANGLEPWTDEPAPNLATIAHRTAKARFRGGDSGSFRRVSELSASEPLPNVWLGVSVENQQRADERITLLLQTPAAIRFLSCEPLLGPIDLAACTVPGVGRAPIVIDALRGKCGNAFGNRVRWVIVGGESGKGFRPMDHAWARSIREQCRAAGIAYFGKQDSAYRNEMPLPGDLGDQEFPGGPQSWPG